MPYKQVIMHADKTIKSNMKNLYFLLFCLTSVLLFSCNEKFEKRIISKENESANKKILTVLN